MEAGSRVVEIRKNGECWSKGTHFQFEDEKHGDYSYHTVLFTLKFLRVDLKALTMLKCYFTLYTYINKSSLHTLNIYNLYLLVMPSSVKLKKNSRITLK